MLDGGRTLSVIQGKLCFQRERQVFSEALHRLSNSEYRSTLQAESTHCKPSVDIFSDQQKWTIISAALPPTNALQALAIETLLSFAGIDFVYLGDNPSQKAIFKEEDSNHLMRMNALDPRLQELVIEMESFNRRVLLFTTAEDSWEDYKATMAVRASIRAAKYFKV